MPGESLISLKRKWQHALLSNVHQMEPQDMWENVLWTDKIDVEMFTHNAQCHIWQNANTGYQNKHLTSAVKHRGGGVMI